MAIHQDQKPVRSIGPSPACTLLSNDPYKPAEKEPESLLRLLNDKQVQHSSTWNTPMNQAQGQTAGVFIVNPQELVRVGIRTLLESVTDFTVVGEAGLRAEAVPLILQLKPEIVMLDLRMLDGKGIETPGRSSRDSRQHEFCSLPTPLTTPSCCPPWPPEPMDMCCKTPEPTPSCMPCAPLLKGSRTSIPA